MIKIIGLIILSAIWIIIWHLILKKGSKMYELYWILWKFWNYKILRKKKPRAKNIF